MPESTKPNDRGTPNPQVAQGADDCASFVDGALGDVLARVAHDAGQFHGEDFSEAADRISYAISSKALPWIDCYGEGTPHDQHIYDGACSICKAGHAPWALRIVIDAVLEAALSDDAVASALLSRLATRGGSE